MLLYPGKLADWGDSPNAYPSRMGYSGPISGVLHAFSSDATARQTFDWFMKYEARATSTMIIAKNGDVFQCCDPNVAHGANCCPSNAAVNYFPPGNANFWTWAIEFEKKSGNLEPLTVPQFKAGCEVIAWLCHVCKTPLKYINGPDGGIMSHSFLDPVHRPGNHDPGPFPWDTLFHYLKGEAMIPNGWKDDGTTLTAPNGIPVVLGFREAVLDDAEWDDANVPQVAEYHVSQVLYHRSDLGEGQVQPFRDDFLWYTKDRGVRIEQELGLEIFLRDKKITELQKALDECKAAGTPPAPVPSKNDEAIAALKVALGLP